MGNNQPNQRKQDLTEQNELSKSPDLSRLFEDSSFFLEETLNEKLNTLELRRPSYEGIRSLESIMPSDIVPGLLTKKWFLLPIVHLMSTNQSLLLNIIPSPANPHKYDGRLNCIFFKNGKPKAVEIDDRLAFDDCGVCVFSNCPNYPWISLIEKAFTKFNGSFWRLENGSPSELYADLTGGYSHQITFNDFATTDGNDLWDELWNRMELEIAQNSFLTVSRVTTCVNREPGLEIQEPNPNTFNNQILLVKSVHILANEEKLVCLQDPWSKIEWKGKYSFQSEEFLGAHQGLSFQEGGCFYMPFSDFLQTFNHLYIGYLPHSTHLLQKRSGFWNQHGLVHFFKFSQNDQYFLSNQSGKSVEILVNLRQTDPRVEDNTSDLYYKSIGIYTVKSEERRRIVLPAIETVSRVDFVMARECTARLELNPGESYIIVPCSLQPGTKHDRYDLTVTSYNETQFTLERLPAMCCAFAEGDWTQHNQGGSFDSPQFSHSPQYLLETVEDITADISLIQCCEHSEEELEEISLYVCVLQDSSQKIITLGDVKDVKSYSSLKKTAFIYLEHVRIEKGERCVIVCSSKSDNYEQLGKKVSFKLSVNSFSTNLNAMTLTPAC